MNTSDFLSIIAIVISVLGFILNRQIDNKLYGPDYRIIVNSIPKGFAIQFENVGNRVMHINRISYSTKPIPDEYTDEDFCDSLSSFFYEIPCETRAEARLIDVNLFPNSKHNLLTTTFSSQEYLLKAWKIINYMTIRIEYKRVLRKHTKYITLSDYYETFMDALRDENGNNRLLKAFSNPSK